MIKRLLSLLSILLLSFSCTVDITDLAHGDITTNSFMINHSEIITSIEIESGLTLVLDDSMTENEVSISTYEGIHSYIKASIEDNEIRFYLNNATANDIFMEVRMSPANISYLSASGASTINAIPQISQTSFTIDLSGMSSFTGGVESSYVDLTCGGASTITISGAVTNLIIKDCSGASTINAGDLVCENIVINVSGASSVDVNVVESLTVDASGASVVTYQGNPAEADFTVTGSSTVSMK